MTDRFLTRRGMLQGTLAGGFALGMGLHAAWAQDAVTGQPAAGRIGEFKISLAEWSLHKRLFASEDVPKANLDFPKMTREEFGIEAVEFVNQFFKDKATDSSYLTELKKRADDQGVACVLIMIDGEGRPVHRRRGRPQQGRRKPQEVGRRRRALGCHAIRVNTGEQLQRNRDTAGADGCGAWPTTASPRDQHHLREPRRPLQRPRRPAGAHQGREQPLLRHLARLRQLPQARGQVLDRRV